MASCNNSVTIFSQNLECNFDVRYADVLTQTTETEEYYDEKANAAHCVVLSVVRLKSEPAQRSKDEDRKKVPLSVSKSQWDKRQPVHIPRTSATYQQMSVARGKGHK